jgi:hypothetical protein
MNVRRRLIRVDGSAAQETLRRQLPVGTDAVLLDGNLSDPPAELSFFAARENLILI